MAEEREQSMDSYSEADEALAFTIDPPPVQPRGWAGEAPLLSCEKEGCGEPQGLDCLLVARLRLPNCGAEPTVAVGKLPRPIRR